MIAHPGSRVALFIKGYRPATNGFPSVCPMGSERTWRESIRHAQSIAGHSLSTQILAGKIANQTKRLASSAVGSDGRISGQAASKRLLNIFQATN